MFENNSSSEWLLYISEWAPPGGGMELSNIRVTTKVAVNALLGDTPALREYGTAIMHNLGTKEVKAVVRAFFKFNLHVWISCKVTSSPDTRPKYLFKIIHQICWSFIHLVSQIGANCIC